MSAAETCWTLIHDAAQGDARARTDFSRRYLSVVRSYLAARWKSPALREGIDDAVQDVFVECFKTKGVLDRADPERPGGFRAYLFAVVRNIAIDAEQKHARLAQQRAGADADLVDMSSHEERLSVVFDRSWAAALMREAAERQAKRARAEGAPALKRVELLRLRFQEDLPIRDIASRWQVDPAWLHHEYARSRQEFKEALLEVVLFHHGAALVASEAEAECARMMGALG